VQRHLKLPIGLTHAGLIAERVTQAFWPFWTVLFFAIAPLLMGWHERVAFEIVWGFGVVALVALVWAFVIGVRGLQWPTQDEAVARVDSRLPGRPIAALNDVQAIGAGDAASEAIWSAHLNAAAGGDVLATGPVWEGWIEPPAYTGKPTLYLADIVANRVQIPQGSFVTIRLYGDVGDLTVTENVSDRTEDEDAAGPATDLQQGFEVTQAGTVTINGEGGTSWEILLLPDAAPLVELTGPVEADANGEMSQPFAARDDYAVVAGTATIALDLDNMERLHGLIVDPEPREPVVIDLPMPFSGDRTDFEDFIIDDFSEHPFANLPVTLTLEVEDALGQTGTSAAESLTLPGRRFFQPLARAVVEQRRDLLWSKANAPRVAQVLRAVSHRPEDVFPDETTYPRLRFIIRRLESADEEGLTDEVRAEVVEAMWELAVQLEEGSLADARARLERAQERLEEAMRNGASDEEIAELMQDLREAMDDYMNLLAQESGANEDGTDQPDQSGESNQITQDELQALMDRIQELMEEGRMAEAMELMEQLNELMENLRVTQGEGGEGGPQTPGEQSMEDLAETLRDQQQLNDEAFQDFQEQFNQGQQQGQQPLGSNKVRGKGRATTTKMV